MKAARAAAAAAKFQKDDDADSSHGEAEGSTMLGATLFAAFTGGTMVANGSTLTAYDGDAQKSSTGAYTVKAFVDKRIISNGLTALHLAVQKQLVDVSRLLLQHGADPSIMCTTADMPVHIAAGGQSLELLRMLLAAGASLSDRGRDQHTPLIRAAQEGNAEMVSYLISLGSDIEAEGASGIFPLWAAAERGHLNVLRVLLEGQPRANINKQDDENSAALHQAASNGHLDCVQFLVKEGADIHLPTHLVSRPLFKIFFVEEAFVLIAMLHAGGDTRNSGNPHGEPRSPRVSTGARV